MCGLRKQQGRRQTLYNVSILAFQSADNVLELTHCSNNMNGTEEDRKSSRFCLF